MNTTILRDIGLTEGEIKVYLALIKLGSVTTGPLTDESKVSRSKIYNILERLIKKGLVSYIIKEKTRHYQAEDPVKIQTYLDKKEKEFKKQRTQIDKIIPQLELQKKLGKEPAEAQIYKGFKGIQTITEHIYTRLKRGDTFHDIGVPSFQEQKYHSYWHKDHVRRVKLGIKCQILFNKGAKREVLKNRNSYKGCDARYMPIPVETPAWILIYKDITVIVLQSDDGMAIEIKNQKIADSFKEYFNAFWKLSKKFK